MNIRCIENVVLNTINDYMGISCSNKNLRFERDLNIDSINFIAIITELENKLQVSIDIGKLLDVTDIKVIDLIDYIANLTR